jgi:glycine/D-amino acid oxidase-like deaminating enzyme
MRQPALRHGQPVWLQRNHRFNQTQYSTLRGHRTTDVAIVGGGMTGAMIAATFAEANVDVTVLEAARTGRGSTAASTALLLQEPDLDLAALSRKYDAARARRIWRISHDTTQAFINIIRRLRISCDLHERDSIYYTLDADVVASLRRELKRRHGAGFTGEWLDPVTLHDETGITCAAAHRR